MAPGCYMMDAASMPERVDENTIMVVPTLGVTYTGAYEPVAAMPRPSTSCRPIPAWISTYVDGASGGFLAPFCAPEVVFDFRLPRVKSISASGHKFGLAPLGVGWVVFRDSCELPDDLIFHVNYLGGDMPVFQINFSRPAGQIVASYYNFLRLGHEGYRRIHQASYEIGQYLAAEIVKLGPFELLCDSNPNTGIPTVTWRIREGRTPATRCSTWLTGCAPGVAGTRLHPHRNGFRHPRAAHPGPHRRQPGHGRPAARRLPRRGSPLRQAPGHRVHDKGGIGRLQPPGKPRPETRQALPSDAGRSRRWHRVAGFLGALRQQQHRPRQEAQRADEGPQIGQFGIAELPSGRVRCSWPPRIRRRRSIRSG